MQAEILIISEEQPPLEFIDFLVKNGFDVHFSRGPLKIKELLREEKIDSICWYGVDPQSDLTDDIIEVLNLRPEIPVVLISSGAIEVELKESIVNYFATIDIQESFKVIRNTIEKSLLQYHFNNNDNVEQEIETEQKQISEIDFRNIVTANEQAVIKKDEMKSHLKIDAPWNMVNSSEKEIILSFQEDEKSFLVKAFNKLGNYFKQ